MSLPTHLVLHKNPEWLIYLYVVMEKRTLNGCYFYVITVFLFDC